MDVLDFIVLTLAASQVVDVWRHGSLFAGLRAYTQAREDGVDANAGAASSAGTAAPPRWMRLANRLLPTWVCALVNCPYCLSHHTPWLLAVGLYLPALLVPWAWLAFLLKVPAYSLAATRLTWVIDAMVPDEASLVREEEVFEMPAPAGPFNGPAGYDDPPDGK